MLEAYFGVRKRDTWTRIMEPQGWGKQTKTLKTKKRKGAHYEFQPRSLYLHRNQDHHRTKQFIINMGQIGTPEFAELKMLRETYPGFTVEPVKTKRKSDDDYFGKLTYKNMEDFIISTTKGEPQKAEALDEYRTVVLYAKGRRGSYQMVKKWFREKYAAEIENHRKVTEAARRKALEDKYLYPTTATHSAN